MGENWCTKYVETTKTSQQECDYIFQSYCHACRLKWKAGASLSEACERASVDSDAEGIDAVGPQAAHKDRTAAALGTANALANIVDAGKPQAGELGLAAERQGSVGCSPGRCGQELRAKLGPMEIRTWAVTLGKYSAAVSAS